jgi:hypothetical protein
MNLAASRAYTATLTSLNTNSVEDGVIYQNSCVNTIFIGLANTKYNRTKYPSADFTKWLPLDGISTLLKMWAIGGNRPDCGAYVGFRTQGRKGKLIFPEYY